jgi:hypothetical protein
MVSLRTMLKVLLKVQEASKMNNSFRMMPNVLLNVQETCKKNNDEAA